MACTGQAAEGRPAQEQPWVRDVPMAVGSDFEAGRCHVTVGDCVPLPEISTRDALEVESSTSRVRNHAPATMEFRA
jgi:hypothetical protein